MEHTQGLAGTSVRVDVSARHFLPIDKITIPFSWSGPAGISYDSFSTAGLRSDYFDGKNLTGYNLSTKQASISLFLSAPESDPYLEPGDGAVVSLWFTIPEGAALEVNPITLESFGGMYPTFGTYTGTYPVATVDGSLRPICCTELTTGNIDCSADGVIDIGDVTAIVSSLFTSLEPVCCTEEADLDYSGVIDVGDVSLLIRSLFVTLDSLPPCP